MDLLSLDEITEVERLADLVRAIRDGNPPGSYSSMRDKEIKGATLYFSALVRKEGRNYKPTSGMIPAWASNVKATDFSTETLESAYDSHQIKLINARVIRITDTVVEIDDEQVSDGPGGQGPRRHNLGHTLSSSLLSANFILHYLSPRGSCYLHIIDSIIRL